MSSGQISSTVPRQLTSGRLTRLILVTLTLLCRHTCGVSGAADATAAILSHSQTRSLPAHSPPSIERGWSEQSSLRYDSRISKAAPGDQKTLPVGKKIESLEKISVAHLDLDPAQMLSGHRLWSHSLNQSHSSRQTVAHNSDALAVDHGSSSASGGALYGLDIPEGGGQRVQQDASPSELSPRLTRPGLDSGVARRFLTTGISSPGVAGQRDGDEAISWRDVLSRRDREHEPQRHQDGVLDKTGVRGKQLYTDINRYRNVQREAVMVVSKKRHQIVNNGHSFPLLSSIKVGQSNTSPLLVAKQRTKRQSSESNSTLVSSSVNDTTQQANSQLDSNTDKKKNKNLDKILDIANSSTVYDTTYDKSQDKKYGESPDSEIPSDIAALFGDTSNITAGDQSGIKGENVTAFKDVQLTSDDGILYNSFVFLKNGTNNPAAVDKGSQDSKPSLGQTKGSGHETTTAGILTTTNNSPTEAPTKTEEGLVLSPLTRDAEAQPDNSSPNTAGPTDSPDSLGRHTDQTTASEGLTTGPATSPEPETLSNGDSLEDSDLGGNLEGGGAGEPEVEPNGKSEGETDGEPEGKPKGEPDGEPEGEPEGEPDGEPEPRGESGIDDEDSPFPLPEPGPHWEEAKQKWGIAWEVHVYGLGGAFGAVGLYSLLSVMRLWRIPRLLSRGYFFSLNLLMFGLCGSRAVYLLYDSYNSGGTFPISLDYFLYSFAFPCLSAAFSVLLYALLKATNMQLVSPSVQRLPVLIFIIVAHFGLSLASDLLIGRFAGARIVLFVCQVYYILWGLFLFAGYAYIFRKLYSHAMKRQKNVIYSSTSSSTFPGGSNGSLTSGKVRSRYTLSTAIKVTFFTALCGLMTVGLELYAVAGVYNTFTWDRPEPWPWYLYHTVLRVLELAMCVTMSYVASQPFRYRRSERTCCTCGVLCVPCGEIFCCGSRNSYNVSDKRHHVTSGGSCSYSDLDLAPTKLHSTRLRSPGDRDQLQGYSSPSSRKRPVISAPGPPQPALLIVEDGYVRFQTDNDINRMVDSMTDGRRVKGGHDIHSANTLPLRDGCFNSGYARHGDEKRAVKDVLDQTDKHFGFLWEDDRSRKSSLAGGEFFRAPSSVSLANSIENELEKAFVTFRMDTSEEAPLDRASSEEHILDITAVSELPNMKETDLISVESFPGASCDALQEASPSLETFTWSCRPASSFKPEILPALNPAPNPAPDPIPSRRPFTLLRRAKSSEVDSTGTQLAWTHMLRRSLSDQATRRPPLKSESSSVQYTHLLDMDSTDSKLSEPAISSLDDVFVRRRPLETTGDNQNVFRKSLLNSSATNDNIDV